MKWSNEEFATPLARWNTFQSALRKLEWEQADAEEILDGEEFNVFFQVKMMMPGFVGNIAHNGDISFEGEVFDEDMSFEGAQFARSVSFERCRFAQTVSFSDARFGGSDDKMPRQFSFEGTVFEGLTSFRGTQFHGDLVTFEGVVFNDRTWFTGADFHCDANFRRAKFDGHGVFLRTEFRGNRLACDRIEIGPQGKVEFADCKHLQEIQASEALIDGKLILTGFTGTATETPKSRGITLNLSNATFTSRPPKLIGFDLSESSNFEGIQWPPGARSREDAADDIHSYERLRGQMERLGAKEVRKLLVNRELACRTALATGWDRIAREIYGAVSGYGQSIERPTKVLLAHWLVVVGTWLAYVATGKTTLSGFDAIGYNISRLFPMTTMRGFHTEEYLDGIRNAPQVLHFLSGTIAVISPILIFLIALGLRNRFRMAD